MTTNTNIDFTEIEKLHSMLTKANIPHTFTTWYDGKQISIYKDKGHFYNLDDVIIHSGSHGVHLGLLETYYLNKCKGYETAEEVFKGWKKMYKKAIKKLDK